MGIFSTITGAAGIGLNLLNLRTQMSQANDQKAAARKQKEYYESVAEDVERKGADQISQLEISGLKEIGELEANTAASGVSLTGTARALTDESYSNIEKDKEVLTQDIAAMVAAAKMTGDTSYMQLMNDAENSEVAGVNQIASSVGGGFRILTDVMDSDTFLDWLK